jgi:CheY-like chemotaxis protein
VRAPASQKTTPGAKETLLVVDDDHAVRRTMKRILEAAGYRVLEAASGENALRILAAHGDAIDLLVTDLRMPKMDGREVTRRGREMRPDLRVLIVTGMVDEGPLPSEGILAKPFSPGSLLKRVEQLLKDPGPSSQRSWNTRTPPGG